MAVVDLSMGYMENRKSSHFCEGMVPLQEPDGWHLKMQIAFQNKSS
jgi:hypothetical protein